MYGYVRPLKGELKIKEYQLFKSAYCGLCHSLKDRYGLISRFIVNYDFTFIGMMLSTAECSGTACRRCIASPFRRKPCHTKDPALDAAADYSVILAYWKLQDSIRDDAFFEKVLSLILSLMLHGSYRRAKACAPQFDDCVEKQLRKLSVLEQENSAGIDAAADCFAKILEAVAEYESDETRKRILGQIFYHVGRIVYILDAVDDLPEDINADRYNVLRGRFNLTDSALSSADKCDIETTLHLSESMIFSAFELLDGGIWTSILSNILYDGLPAVSGLVLSGKWREMRKAQKETMNGAKT